MKGSKPGAATAGWGFPSNFQGTVRGEAFEHYLTDASRRRSAPPGALTGAAGGAACGDVSRISLVLDRGVVVEAGFDSEGCGAVRAASAAAAELAEGATVIEAARIGTADLDRELGGLTAAGRHGPTLAADALHRALAAAAASAADLAPPAADRVLVAMSGGVDSAVAALLERRRGADVVAVTLKLWADPLTDGAKACCSPEAVVGARALAHSLAIPHLTLDLEEEFRRRVVADFLSGYAAGRTPNPCLLCNGEVRIAAMVDLADRLGAAKLVTGHYARIADDGAGPLLRAAADPAKDQSYMLAALPPRLLSRLRFPLAELTKPEVRAIAADQALPVSRKPESQDLCFLAGQGKGEFLRRHGGLGDRAGELVDSSGRSLGRHRGHHHFTVGQRRGIGVAAAEPLYVLATDAEANTVTVGVRAELRCDSVAVRDAVLHRPSEAVDAVRLRYRSRPVAARVVGANGPGRYDSLRVELEQPFAGPAPGQAAVFLAGESIVGHGRIAAG
jgi:tRNA-uridine 2-sulfurtransferase